MSIANLQRGEGTEKRAVWLETISVRKEVNTDTHSLVASLSCRINNV